VTTTGGTLERRVVILRHGETTHNAAGIWQGQLDSPLSELGLRQADAVGAAVAALRPDRLVSSDLSRARMTAESVGRACGIPVVLDPRFREVDAGAWQGRSSAEVAQRWPEERAAMLRGEDVRRGGDHGDGERMADVLVRVGEALDELLAEDRPGECLVVSTHGGAAKAVAGWLLRLDLEVAWRVLSALGNCHWGELHEGRLGWRLQTWNVGPVEAPRTHFTPP
jgi:glucosyl-3-phosphoglycerate phosphatase